MSSQALARVSRTRGGKEPCGEPLFALTDRPCADSYDPPFPASQTRADPSSDHLLLARLGHEQGPESREFGTCAKVVVVRPAARLVVFPMPAQRNRDGSVDRSPIAFGGQRDLCFGYKRSCVTHTEKIRERAAAIHARR